MTKKWQRQKRREHVASQATIEQRVQQILQIILDGAETWDILQYCSEKQAKNEPPWNRGPNQKPLSDRQIRTYVARAKERIVQAGAEHDADAFRHHLAKRRNLYARAVQSGDNRTALAILADMARLQDLYPAEKKQHEHQGGLDIRIVADDDFYANRDRLESAETAEPSAAGVE